MMRVVLDANVFVSAVLSTHGAPARIVDAWHAGIIDVLITEPILQEIGRVLLYPRIVKRHQQSPDHIATFLKELAYVSVIIEDTPSLSVIADDPDDDKYLECAVGGDADYLVGGDNHLLQLRSYQHIPILSAPTLEYRRDDVGPVPQDPLSAVLKQACKTTCTKQLFTIDLLFIGYRSDVQAEIIGAVIIMILSSKNPNPGSGFFSIENIDITNCQTYV